MEFQQTGILRNGARFGVYFFLSVGIFVCSLIVLEMIREKVFSLEVITALILIAFFFGLIAILGSCFFPSWEISENKFQIQSLFFKTAWLNWHEIIAIRQLPRGIYAIRIDRLPWPYIVQGFSYGLGGRTFLLSQKINDYDSLFKILSEKRPDLFE